MNDTPGSISLGGVFCPSCHKRTLQARWGAVGMAQIACTNSDCDTPWAAQLLLTDNEPDCIVYYDEDTYTVRHPLKDRLGAELYDSQVHRLLRRSVGPRDGRPGIYRVKIADLADDTTAEGALTFDWIGPIPGTRLKPDMM